MKPRRTPLACTTCKGPALAGQKMKLCSVCQTAAYCCRDCQKLDWGRHKDICLPVAERCTDFDAGKYSRIHTHAITKLAICTMPESIEDRYFIFKVQDRDKPPTLCMSVLFSSKPSLSSWPGELASCISSLDESHDSNVAVFCKMKDAVNIILVYGDESDPESLVFVAAIPINTTNEEIKNMHSAAKMLGLVK